MKRLALLFAVAAAAGAALAAQDYTVVSTSFDPAIYYVGDRVEMSMVIRSALADKMVEPKQPPQPSWGVVESVRLLPRADGQELRIVFVSYAAGTRTLPPINLGEVVLEGVNVYVASALGGAASPGLAPLRGQAAVPGTAWWVALQAALLAAAPAAALLAWSKGRPAWRRRRQRRREGLPYRRLQRGLHAAGAAIENLDVREFYTRVMRDLRLYLSDRMRVGALAATSAELEALLGARVHHRESVDRVVALFRRGDRVKFAGETCSLQVRMGDLHQVEEAMRHIEQEERMRGAAAETGADRA